MNCDLTGPDSSIAHAVHLDLGDGGREEQGVGHALHRERSASVRSQPRALRLLPPGDRQRGLLPWLQGQGIFYSSWLLGAVRHRAVAVDSTDRAAAPASVHETVRLPGALLRTQG